MLAWLSILAYRNKDVPVGGKLVTIEDVSAEFWEKYGRNFFRWVDVRVCVSVCVDEQHTLQVGRMYFVSSGRQEIQSGQVERVSAHTTDLVTTLLSDCYVSWYMCCVCHLSWRVCYICPVVCVISHGVQPLRL